MIRNNPAMLSRASILPVSGLWKNRKRTIAERRPHMKADRNTLKHVLRVLMSVLVCAGAAGKASFSTENQIYKHFTVDIHLFSFNSENPLNSYKFHGSGSSGGGMVGLAYGDSNRYFRVNTTAHDRFLVSVGIVPDEKDKLTIPQNLSLIHI